MLVPDQPTVPRHPIAVVAERTRLSQDVLRVWERRYRVVEPGRSASGQRLYSDADIERLRLLSFATRMGRTISQVAGLPTAELARIVREDEDARGRAGPDEPSGDVPNELVESALEYVRALDASSLNAMLHRALLSMGMPAFLDAVATPLLRRIGDEWHGGRLVPAQEHLASAIIQRVIINAMQTVTAPAGAPNLVIATPSGERHEIGALLAAAAAASEGWRVTYLGADLPAADIADAAVRTNARAVGLSIVYIADQPWVLDEISILRTRLPASIALLVGGAAGVSLAAKLSRDGIRLLADLGALRETLRRDRTTLA